MNSTKKSVSPKKKTPIIPQVICIVMLIWAIIPLNPGGYYINLRPYGYFILLRIVVCSICLYLAVYCYQNELTNWVWLLSIIAIVFNPIIPIHLNKELWMIIDIVTIIVFLFSFSHLRPKKLRNDYFRSM